jgi:hypothetical protein
MHMRDPAKQSLDLFPIPVIEITCHCPAVPVFNVFSFVVVFATVVFAALLSDDNYKLHS